MSSGGAEIIGFVMEAIAPSIGRAFSIFLKTTAGLVLLSAIFLYGSYWYASQTSSLHGWLSLGGTFVFCVIGSSTIAGKQTLTSIIIHTLEEYKLGSKTIPLLFHYILAVDDKDDQGTRGTQIAQLSENLPLKEAELLFTNAVNSLISTSTEKSGLSSWFKTKVSTFLLQKIEQITLAEFRTANQTAGGVNLILVRERLASEVDILLIKTIKSASLKSTLLILAAIALASCLLSYGLVCYLPVS
jgi:hypothetical protein